MSNDKMREAEKAASDYYFSERAKGLDTIDRRSVYCAAFRDGANWQAALTQQPESRAPLLGGVIVTDAQMHEFRQRYRHVGPAIAEPLTQQPESEPVVPNEQGKNRYGLDVPYFRRLINRELNRPLTDFRPDEFARVCARMAATADREVLQESEFGRKQPSAQVPDDLRAQGLTVAVHNDYRLDGDRYTFWLLTDESGMSYKGEGRTDAEALNQIRAQLTAAPSIAEKRDATLLAAPFARLNDQQQEEARRRFADARPGDGYIYCDHTDYARGAPGVVWVRRPEPPEVQP